MAVQPMGRVYSQYTLKLRLYGRQKSSIFCAEEVKFLWDRNGSVVMQSTSMPFSYLERGSHTEISYKEGNYATACKPRNDIAGDFLDLVRAQHAH